MGKNFNRKLTALVEEWQDYISPSDLPVEHDGEGYGAFDDYAKDDEQEAAIPPSGEVEVFDAAQRAREAVRMLKKRGYRANDAVKAAMDRKGEDTYVQAHSIAALESNAASERDVAKFMSEYVEHTRPRRRW
jgi:hypothetical protein